MGIFSVLVQKIEKDKATCHNLCEEAQIFLESKEQSLTSNDEFLDASFSDEVKTACDELEKQIKNLPLSSRITNRELSAVKKAIKQFSDSVDSRIIPHNDNVAEKLTEKARELIGNVEGKALDDQQMKCIVKPILCV